MPAEHKSKKQKTKNVATSSQIANDLAETQSAGGQLLLLAG